MRSEALICPGRRRFAATATWARLLTTKDQPFRQVDPMAVSDHLPAPRPPEPAASLRLDSWKEIATYLKRDESTVRRWEKEGLPVHRHAHKKKATVFAYASEIDLWWRGDRARLEPQAPEHGEHRAR